MSSTISIEHVSRHYVDNKGELIEVLNDIKANIKSGEFISIIGPSGCGKTTLLRLIAGLDQPQKGDIRINGKIINAPSSDLGYVFQRASLFPWETIKNNIASGLDATGNTDDKDKKITKYVHLMGLDGFENAFPHQISGGMTQRAALARSLIVDPEVLLLDEPLGALDAFTRTDIQRTISKIWQQTNKTMILVTHDVDEAIFLSDRIFVMTPRPGKIKAEVVNDLPFPRDRNSSDFFKIRKSLFEKLSF